MRLEEWQRFIETQFLDDEPEAQPEPPAQATPPLPAPPTLAKELTETSETTEEPPVVKVETLPPVVAPAPPPLTAVRETEEIAIPSFERYLPPQRRPQPDLVPQPKNPPPAPSHQEPQPTVVEHLRPRSEAPPAPPRKHSNPVPPPPVTSDATHSEFWANVPRHIQTLLALGCQDEEEVAQNSYKRPFAEKRRELIERILDPVLSLEDTARLLNVCPTTVRRYTNKGILNYYRKEPDNPTQAGAALEKETRQRRFRLSDILTFLETQQAALEADSEEPRARRKKRDPEETQ